MKPDPTKFSLSLLIILALAGCSSGPRSIPDSPGGYYGGDSAPDPGDVDFDKIPDAVPRAEPRSKTGNKPYSALGNTYRPLVSSRGYMEQGVASWYGTKFHGRRTSSGETYDMWKMTAAHPVLPLPTYVRVTNMDTGKSIVVKVNDRGPFLHDRIIDLSFAAAHKLGIAEKGTGNVLVQAVGAESVVTGTQSTPSPENQVKTTGLGSYDAPESYFVQVGAYSDVANSLSMRERLSQQGLDVHPRSQDEFITGGQPFRVQVGPYNSMEQAIKVKTRLEQSLGQTLLIVIN